MLDVERLELRREHFVRGVPIKELMLRTGRNDGLNWPHCDGLNWPHLRPTGGRPFELHRARAGGARGNGIQGGAVRADQTGS